MEKLYFIHFNACMESGINKKIDAQINQFRRFFEVKEIDVPPTLGHSAYLHKFAVNIPILYSPRCKYNDVISEIDDGSIVYIRRTLADRYYIKFLHMLREKQCVILIEIPTYPYFKDDFSKITTWPAFFKELCSIPQFKKYVDRFVTYSNDKKIFGVSTLNVKNGIYVDQVEARKPLEDQECINLLAVATFRKHHGYERVIKGIADYYSNGGNRNIILRMVGEGSEKKKYVDLADKLNLKDHVLFLGQMVGDNLSKQYDLADVALGTFGLYKIDVFSSSVLKVREYLAKGLPIISGCHEDAFEDEPFGYYLEFPNDKSTVDMFKVIDFYDKIYKGKNLDDKNNIVTEIREYARRHVNYDVVFKNVIDYLNEVRS